MKKISAGLLVSLIALSGCAQGGKKEKSPVDKFEKSLLWKVSGNGLEKPTFLFGTMHMLCKEDAFLGENLVGAIKSADKVYFELDMDNLFDMLGAMSKLKMKNDTTLADLMTKDEYEKVKIYFKEKSTMLPFSVLETYKPFIASSMLMETTIVCDEQVAMEQLIMEEAKKHNKTIEGLETTAYQMGIFDSIPYKEQAKELVKMVAEDGKESDGDKEFKEMMKAYKEQDLKKLADMINSEEAGMMKYQDILLNNRNRNWVEKLKKLMVEKSLVVAVGAGHLPGDKGVINLLRKAGYTVVPVENKAQKNTKEI
jgi:uncharacterized protein YbaP (TraB family)